MNKQQGRTDDKNKKNEQRRESDTKKPSDQKLVEKKPDEPTTGTPDGQQHGGSGRGMKRADSEDGTNENGGGKPANNKPFADVRKGENHATDASEKTKSDATKTAGVTRAPEEENAADEDEMEGGTAKSRAH